MSDLLAAKLEFELEHLDHEKIDALKQKLGALKGVNDIEIKHELNKIYVETILPTSVVHEEIEKCAESPTVLKGMGSSLKNAIQNLDAAVAEVSSLPKGAYDINGVIRFVQLDAENCAIDGTIDGLQSGEHAIHVFEYGDFSDGFNRIGNHFNPHRKRHGLPTDEERHAGDLGNIKADDDGRATFRIVDRQIKIWDIIGRSICVSEKADYGNNETGERLACGIIARSAWIFENVKKICACSGKTLWDERMSRKTKN